MNQKLCSHDQCTGCMSCLNACPASAIRTQTDAEGFWHPEIMGDECIDCGKCTKACPILNPPHRDDALATKEIYAAWSRDSETRRQSSSGGFFSEAASVILGKGGVVYGAAYDGSLVVKHVAVTSTEELSRLRGSKYVQSMTGDVFQQVATSLKSGRLVLFTGTPCQVAGLHSFLRRPHENLYTADILCHGVPSPRVFEDYKRWLQKMRNAPLGNLVFRDKKWSWKDYNIRAVFDTPEGAARIDDYIKIQQQDPFMRGFLRNYYLRPACHACRFANMDRPGDISMGDFWGYRRRKGLYKDTDEGVSLILANTQRGKDLIDSCRDALWLTGSSKAEAMPGNKALSRSAPAPGGRALFWEDFEKGGFEGILTKYLHPQRLKLRQRVLVRFGRRNFLYKLLLHISYLSKSLSSIGKHKSKHAQK